MKGLIIAAGYGSRFFPCTRTVPKEMLPLYNIPSIHFAVNELVEAGIKDLIVVTSRRKKSLEDYFDVEFELETFFEGREEVKPPQNVNVCFVRQKRMLGVGNAILEAASFIGDDFFVLLYPDDIVISNPSLSSRLVKAFELANKSVISILDKGGEDVSRFGVVKFHRENDFIVVDDIVEKPEKGAEPSSYIAIGRYLFTSELIYKLKRDWESFSGKGEFYHINAILELCRENKVVAVEVDKESFFDTGTPFEYSKSFIRYVLKYSSQKEEIKEWIKSII